MSTRSGEREAAYRELRERSERHERGREENLKRIVELHRERHLHSFQSRDAGVGADASQ